MLNYTESRVEFLWSSRWASRNFVLNLSKFFFEFPRSPFWHSRKFGLKCSEVRFELPWSSFWSFLKFVLNFSEVHFEHPRSSLKFFEAIWVSQKFIELSLTSLAFSDVSWTFIRLLSFEEIYRTFRNLLNFCEFAEDLWSSMNLPEVLWPLEFVMFSKYIWKSIQNVSIFFWSSPSLLEVGPSESSKDFDDIILRKL